MSGGLTPLDVARKRVDALSEISAAYILLVEDFGLPVTGTADAPASDLRAAISRLDNVLTRELRRVEREALTRAAS